MIDCKTCFNSRHLEGLSGEFQCPACREKPEPHPDPKGAMEAAVRAIRPPYCADCGSSKLDVHYTWVSRCQKCSDKFQAEIQAKRKREFEDERARFKSHTYKRDLDGHCPDDGETCEECCEHEFDTSEGGMCLNCDAEAV